MLTAVTNWLLDFRLQLASWIVPLESKSEKQLRAKQAIYHALMGLELSEAIRTCAEIITEYGYVPQTSSQAAQIGKLVEIAQELTAEEFIYLLAEAIKQMLEQKYGKNVEDV